MTAPSLTGTDRGPTATLATATAPPPARLAAAMHRACSRIAPLWPLDRFVAVNPYLGVSDLPFVAAADRLARVAGAPTTLPARDYLEAIDHGVITLDDLAAALGRHQAPSDADAEAFLAAVRAHGGGTDEAARVPTVARVAAAVTGCDWPAFVTDRISAWAASYFDEGQSTWRPASTRTALLAAWRAEAAIDRTPEVMGLHGFRTVVRALPDEPTALISLALARLQVEPDEAETYLHALLMRNGGWAAHAARVDWERRSDDHAEVLALLAVCTAWELALHDTLGHDVVAAWRAPTGAAQRVRDAAGRAIASRVTLQDAFDIAAQRRVIEEFGATPSAPDPAPARAQAVFCIDVRSEVLRRHLESVAPDLRTIGFAGFFGFPVEHIRLGHTHGDAQCPVLLEPTAAVHETVGNAIDDRAAVEGRRLAHHVRRAWKSFKMGAVSCFSFVGPVGLAYLPKLVTDSTGATRPVPVPSTESLPAADRARLAPSIDHIPLAARTQLAYGALRAMSLTHDFAAVVLLVGHASNTVNNPYAAGLDCGACGGHSGAVNARVAAAVCNDPEVRAELTRRELSIPDTTWFVAGVHDTTTDDVRLFVTDVPESHRTAVDRLADDLCRAGALTRRERAARLGIGDGADVDRAVRRRSRDWAQVRPEWGLAGCHCFVVAPRARTRGIDLRGRAFLHSYDWRADHDFSVLELIMTAPMVVASWINLQYYASTVAPEVFGSGNKTLHNVVGQLGVFEGNGGDLRVGLPLQSLHDGVRRQHDPLRLMVIIDAPTEAISGVLAAHPEVRQLVDHGWVHLFAMDDAGAIAHRYAGDLHWTAASGAPGTAPEPRPEEELQ